MPVSTISLILAGFVFASWPSAPRLIRLAKQSKLRSHHSVYQWFRCPTQTTEAVEIDKDNRNNKWRLRELEVSQLNEYSARSHGKTDKPPRFQGHQDALRLLRQTRRPPQIAFVAGGHHPIPWPLCLLWRCFPPFRTHDHPTPPGMTSSFDHRRRKCL
jgi:hypothetical protein